MKNPTAGTAKNLGVLLQIAAGVGAGMQRMRGLARAVGRRRIYAGKYRGHQGPREMARRCRQMAAGQLQFHSTEWSN
jgi:hypothetical protein